MCNTVDTALKVTFGIVVVSHMHNILGGIWACSTYLNPIWESIYSAIHTLKPPTAPWSSSEHEGATFTNEHLVRMAY